MNRPAEARAVSPLSQRRRQAQRPGNITGSNTALNGPRLATSWHWVSSPTGNTNVNETNALSLLQETRPASSRASSEHEHSAPIPEAPRQTIDATASAGTPDGHESYERGTAVKNVGLFRQAAEHFQHAAQDPAYALKGFAQMGLCLTKSGKQEDAVAAFRRALQVPSATSKERVQILYLLGRTFESLRRIPDALEAYRWLRREAPQYRDVASRVASLSTRRVYRDPR